MTSRVGFQMFQNIDGGGSICPTINISDVVGVPPTVGNPFQDGCIITGGAEPYSLVSVTGDIPPSAVVRVVEFGGNWFVAPTGTATQAGSFTFTANIKDSNNCPGTKEITIIVT